MEHVNPKEISRKKCRSYLRFLSVWELSTVSPEDSERSNESLATVKELEFLSIIDQATFNFLANRHFTAPRELGIHIISVEALTLRIKTSTPLLYNCFYFSFLF